MEQRILRCNEVPGFIEKEFEGTLKPEFKAKLERHLTRCSPCRESYLREQTRREQLKFDAEFQPNDEYWRNFHSKLAQEIDRRETLHERLSRWKLAHFPTTLFRYSSFGLLKLLILGMMIIFSIVLFRAEHTNSRVQDPAAVTVEHDSSGIPLYHIAVRK